MDNIKVYKPPSGVSQVEAFIEDLEPKLRDKLVWQIFRLSRTPPAGLKEPHYKHFSIEKKGKLIIQKRDSISGQPLPGAQFRVTTAAGCEVGLDGVIGTATLTQNGIFTTDSNGEIRLSNLAPGALILTEIKAPAGYVIDNPSTNVMIGSNGDTQTVIVTNASAPFVPEKEGGDHLRTAESAAKL